MAKSKLFTGLIVILFFLGMAPPDFAAAGEKVSVSATSVRTNWQSMEVEDEPGHIIAVFENKNIYLDEKTGEKSTGINKGILDMNLKTGKGTVKGYVIRSFPNGDKIISQYEGQPVGKGHSKGTYTIKEGTGNWEGIKGKGTWQSKTLAKGISYIDFVGEREIPAK